MHSSIDSLHSAQNPQFCDLNECCEFSKDSSKLATNAGESKCDTEDAMRYTACSTNVFSEMGTLESIPTLSNMGFWDNPLLQEVPKSDNHIPAQQANVLWRGMTSRRAQANALQQRDSPTTSLMSRFRKWKMSKKRKEENSEEATTGIQENENECEGRPVIFSFHLWKQGDADTVSADASEDMIFLSGDASFLSSDASLLEDHDIPTSAGQASKDTLFSGISRIDEEAYGEVPGNKQVLSNDCDPCAETSKQSSNLESLERSTITQSTSDLSLDKGASFMVGPPGRALRKRHVEASTA